MKIPAIPSPQIGPEYTYMGRYQWASHIKPKVHVPRYSKSRPSMVCPKAFHKPSAKNPTIVYPT